ncbi:hypothetical protein [Roseobacter sp. AzwK-3b]|uniref:hypothetical protein n=1 Tax=Roseobacter sp. AzwK-3b TaxID=351016 RepID=UPI0003078254|nr:hypothetical protein [Roseobacter sp. AzwK-3b]
MTHVMTPFTLSAAGFRLAGYLLENNLRVAQEFGRAALIANPFLLRKSATYVRPVTTAPVEKKAAAVADKTAGTSAEPVLTEPKSAVTLVASEPKPAAPKAPAAQGQVVPMSPARPAAKTIDLQADTGTPKRPRAPSKPPAMPAPRSVAMNGRDTSQA